MEFETVMRGLPSTADIEKNEMGAIQRKLVKMRMAMRLPMMMSLLPELLLGFCTTQ